MPPERADRNTTNSPGSRAIGLRRRPGSVHGAQAAHHTQRSNAANRAARVAPCGACLPRARSCEDERFTGRGGAKKSRQMGLVRYGRAYGVGMDQSRATRARENVHRAMRTRLQGVSGGNCLHAMLHLQGSQAQSTSSMYSECTHASHARQSACITSAYSTM